MVKSFILTDTQVSWISISVALLRWTGLITVSPKKVNIFNEGKVSYSPIELDSQEVFVRFR